MTHHFFAICPRGLEPLLIAELTALGATAAHAEAGGVGFEGSLEAGYRANLWSRLASRILWQVALADVGPASPAQAQASPAQALYDLARSVPWEQHFDSRHTLRVDLSASRTPLQSLDFATLRIKDAIVDRIRDRSGSRPTIDRAAPDARVYGHLEGARATLFKRGWRRDKGEAPIKENLAAGLLQLAGWTPEQPLLDPFCGSGTIVIEAALRAGRRAPGLGRHFGLERLHGFDRALWRQLLEEAGDLALEPADVILAGQDISTRVIEIAQANAARAGLQHWLADGRLRLTCGDARDCRPPRRVDVNAGGMVVTNPPYGEQSNPKSATVPKLMAEFATCLKQEFAGWSAWILTSDRTLPRQMRLHETRRTVLFNGALECRLFRFDLVAGGYRRADRRPILGGPIGPLGPILGAAHESPLSRERERGGGEGAGENGGDSET